MSFSQPSQVSATTGSDHQAPVASSGPCATRHAITASRTTPTLWVLVIITGPSRNPDSSTQVVPVISPLPFCANHPAKTGLFKESAPRGSTAVTPVRTGPWPTCNLPDPEISVVWPTVTPATSVMALSGPGVPSKGTPRSRARGFPEGAGAVGANVARAGAGAGAGADDGEAAAAGDVAAAAAAEPVAPMYVLATVASMRATSRVLNIESRM